MNPADFSAGVHGNVMRSPDQRVVSAARKLSSNPDGAAPAANLHLVISPGF
jgi:hypothetical protein